MTRVRVDHVNYPYCHRSEQGAIDAARRIISNLK
jgi:hypothetical protein